MRTPNATLRLTPSSLTLESASARASRPLDPATWSDVWSRGLTDLLPSLKSLVQETGSQGAAIEARFDSPNAHAGVISIPGTGRAVIDAALLSLEEQIGALDEWCVAAEVISRSEERSHVLTCAENERAADQVARLAVSAGLKPVEQRSLLSVALESAVTAAVGACEPDASIAQLSLEDDRLVVCVASRGRLAFVRSATVGLSHLATPLARQLAGERAGLNARELDEAMRILREIGIPDQNTPIPGSELRGRDVLPSMQSVLQRIALELRQSVRFGLPSDAPRPVRLALHAQAGEIANLGELLAVELEQDDFASSVTTSNPAPAHRSNVPLLLPRSARERRAVRRSQRVAIAGIALACAVTGVEAGWNHWNAGAIDMQRASLLAGAPSGEQMHAELVDAQFRVTRTHQRLEVLADQLGASAKVAPVLRQLADSRPDRVRMTDVSFSAQGGTPTCQVWGLVEHAGDGDDASGARALLVDFARVLTESPLVRDVQLGSTSRVEQAGAESVHFGLTIELVPTSTLSLLGNREGSGP
ncbi:MAG: hypothetical protein AAGD00_05720 [Planctomycetota bacterium]